MQKPLVGIALGSRAVSACKILLGLVFVVSIGGVVDLSAGGQAQKPAGQAPEENLQVYVYRPRIDDLELTRLGLTDLATNYIALRAALSPEERPSLDSYFVHKNYQHLVKRIEFFVGLRLRAKLWYSTKPAASKPLAKPASPKKSEPIEVFVYNPSHSWVEAQTLSYAKIRKDYLAVEFPENLAVKGLDDFYLVDRSLKSQIKKLQAGGVKLDPKLERELQPSTTNGAPGRLVEDAYPDSTRP